MEDLLKGKLTYPTPTSLGAAKRRRNTIFTLHRCDFKDVLLVLFTGYVSCVPRQKKGQLLTKAIFLKGYVGDRGKLTSLPWLWGSMCEFGGSKLTPPWGLRPFTGSNISKTGVWLEVGDWKTIGNWYMKINSTTSTWRTWSWENKSFPQLPSGLGLQWNQCQIVTSYLFRKKHLASKEYTYSKHSNYK